MRCTKALAARLPDAGVMVDSESMLQCQKEHGHTGQHVCEERITWIDRT